MVSQFSLCNHNVFICSEDTWFPSQNIPFFHKLLLLWIQVNFWYQKVQRFFIKITSSTVRVQFHFEDEQCRHEFAHWKSLLMSSIGRQYWIHTYQARPDRLYWALLVRLRRVESAVLIPWILKLMENLLYFTYHYAGQFILMRQF